MMNPGRMQKLNSYSYQLAKKSSLKFKTPRLEDKLLIEEEETMPFREAGGTITTRKTGKKGLPPKDKNNRMTISHQEIDASKLLDISEISKRSQILPKTARR